MSESTATFVRVKVWDLPTRYTHWLIALSIFALVPTGLYIGRPFGPGVFLMGWVKRAHFIAATVFTLAVLARVVWMFIGNRYARWNELLPVTRRRIAGVLKTVFFYTLIFRRPPASLGHNPLAGASYLAVFFMYLTMILTGLSLYAPSTISPLHAFAALLPWFGGAAMARYVHHLVTWLLVIFTVSHMATALLTSIVEGNGEFDSIFSGYKALTPGDLREVREGEAQDERRLRAVRRLWSRRREKA